MFRNMKYLCLVIINNSTPEESNLQIMTIKYEWSQLYKNLCLFNFNVYM